MKPEQRTYVLKQRFVYTYDEPIRQLDHRLIVVPPPRHGDQRRRGYSLSVTGADAQVTHQRDAAGNTITRTLAPLVPERVEFLLEAVVERVGPAEGVPVPTVHPWLLQPTRLTTPDAKIREVAAALSDGDALASAERFCSYVHDAIAYTPGSTTVDTTAAQALAAGHGVCQDSAHLMLALCRSAGLPARYVSGHLLGEGGTHAWVEVVVPEARAVAFDPCNGRRAGWDYLTVATGRDYADVARRPLGRM
ncbi:transglutaminase family protein [Fodinicola feengrottensis]|uniref:transglutaminase family protein n=1 Tax=Fodinicola feengrottensis TaxID=435914 RepID=UPI0013D528F9|nr:transglutaminase family protein [Fodinicola feengrottensis]